MSLLSGKTEARQLPVMAAHLAGGFGALIALLIGLAWTPGLLEKSFWPTILLVGIDSFATVWYVVWAYGLGLPLLLHLGYHLMLNVAVLNLWGILGGGAGVILNPIQLIRVAPERFQLLAITVVIALLLADSVTRMERMLQNLWRKAEARFRQTQNYTYQPGQGVVLDEVEKLDLTPNLVEWKSLRFKVVGLLALGLFCLNCRVPRLVGLEPVFPAAILLLATFTGLLLLTRGYYDYQRAVWKSEGLEPDVSTSVLWQKWTLGLGLAALLLTAPLPAFPPLGSILGDRFIHSMENQSNYPNRFETDRTPNNSHARQFPRKSEGDPVSLAYFLVMVLVCLGGTGLIAVAVLVGAGYLLYKSAAGEAKKWRGLPRFLVRCYLKWRGFWAHTRERLQARRGRLREMDREERRVAGMQAKKAHYTWGRGTRAVVRRGYFRLISLARKQGLPWRDSQAPREMAEQLAQMLPDEPGKVAQLTETYLRARYGADELPAEEVPAFERLRKALAAKLQGRS